MEGLEPLTTNNNLMDLAQLSGCAFCYLELKFGKEYATMKMTKSEQIRAGLQKSFQSGSSAKASTVATVTGLPHPVNWSYTLRRPPLCSISLSVLKLAIALGKFLPHWLTWRLFLPPAKPPGAGKQFQNLIKREVCGICYLRKDTGSRWRSSKVIRCQRSSLHEESSSSYHSP